MSKKYVSEFVKRQQALEARNVMHLLWNAEFGTYRKAKYGPLFRLSLLK
jgi:hypothetical protein